MTTEPFIQHTFQAYLARGKLMGSRCQNCQALHVPPRPICPECFGQELAWEELSGRGTLKAFTVVHIGLSAMIEAGYDRSNPYVAAIVELAEGPSISAQLLGVDAQQPQEISIGMPLRMAIQAKMSGEPEEEPQVRLAFEAD